MKGITTFRALALIVAITGVAVFVSKANTDEPQNTIQQTGKLPTKN